MKLFGLRERTGGGQPVEVGVVRWGRDLDEARRHSRDTGKPIFALFQEVPGCAGCKQFGRDVLSDRVVVDAIEELFVPLLIHNNSPGRDGEICEMFGEPSWNYQVVRFLDADGADIIARQDRVWDTGPLVARMVATLEQAGRPVPAYLRLIEQEHSERLRRVHFAQGCFWVGETEIGQIDGVVATSAAFMGGHEVTSVWFDPAVVTLVSLTEQCVARGVASAVFADPAGIAELADGGYAAHPIDEPSHRVALGRDQKRQIGSVVRRGDLSEAQLTKLNAFLPISRDLAAQYLPPSRRSGF